MLNIDGQTVFYHVLVRFFRREREKRDLILYLVVNTLNSGRKYNYNIAKFNLHFILNCFKFITLLKQLLKVSDLHILLIDKIDRK